MIVVTLHCKEVASGGRGVAPTGGGNFLRLEDRPLLQSTRKEKLLWQNISTLLKKSS